MGKSLFEFANEKKEEEKATNFKNGGEQGISDDLKNQFDKYSKYTQKELQQELFSKVGQQKASGEFDFAEISNRLNQIKPMLSKDQIEKLESLLKQIK